MKKRTIVVRLDFSNALVVLLILIVLFIHSLESVVNDFSAYQLGDTTMARLILSVLSSAGWGCALGFFIKLVWNEWRK